MSDSSPPITILICEDQRLMRESLQTVLDLEPGLRVMGMAADGGESVTLALTLRPDVILMDIKMPISTGVAATASITTQWPDARIIILTTFDQDDLVFEALEAGAIAYLLKDVPATELVETIRRVYAGERFVQPSMAARLLSTYRQRGRLGHDTHSADVDQLSEREVEVLRLVARGASNREIADQLMLAEGTVKNYVSTVLQKLHAANRTHAATLARERGLI